jgi:Arc/MetJ-type ribon-helix-helix transcriptional regulator
MTVMKPRSRMISVRLSEEEYSALRQLCSLTGARSVSDLTRDAMRNVLRGGGREEAFAGNLDEFRAGMRSLEKKVEQLEAKITSIRSEPAAEQS